MASLPATGGWVLTKLASFKRSPLIVEDGVEVQGMANYSQGGRTEISLAVELLAVDFLKETRMIHILKSLPQFPI